MGRRSVEIRSEMEEERMGADKNDVKGRLMGRGGGGERTGGEFGDGRKCEEGAWEKVRRMLRNGRN